LDPRWVEILAASDEAARAGNFGYTTWTSFPPKTEAYLISEIEKVWTGTITVDQFMKGMDDTFAPELANGAVPAIPSP
jgi:raffinose/stachyose/melibiose transport system substrate-binding protein